MNRRRFLFGAAGAITVAAVPGVMLVGGRPDGSSASATSSTSGRATAKVTKRDLAQRLDLKGTLGYGAAHALALARPGTITALPDVGAVIDRGGTIAEVDASPVVLLFGSRPLWRPLGEGVDDGPDVEQLEANLIALGHATDATLGPNQRWSATTTAAVKRWQKALGVEESGTVSTGDVVFEAGPVRIAERIANVGAMAAGPALKVTGTTRAVSVRLEANRRALVALGQPVIVVLPDGTNVGGSVGTIGTVASAGEQGSSPTIDVVIALDDASTVGDLDQAPVTVKVTTTSATGVLAVPVGALLALSEGGYAVERVRSDGTTELVGVTLGPFADGWVQVTGAVAEGDQVVVPK